MSDIVPWPSPNARGPTNPRVLTRQSAPAARFATEHEILSLRWRYRPWSPTILLGNYRGELIGLDSDDRHMLTVAGTRAGKGISLIIPTLVTYPGSCFVLDPKGELARKTSRARRDIHDQDVVVLDPYGVSGQPSDSCNPLDMIDLKSPFAPADIQILLEALIATASDSSNGAHFTASARNLVMALIVFAKVHLHKASLADVWELLSGRYGTVAGSMEKPSDVFNVLLQTEDLNRTPQAMARAWLEIPEREQGSILSTARTALQFLEGFGNPDAAMTRVSASSDFTPADLKRRRVTVYLCLPASYMHTYRAWLRMFVNMTIVALEMTPAESGGPAVLLLLDEFATLGYLPTIEKAAGLMAGYGVKLFLIVQNLRQLEASYGNNWETFIGNAGVTTWHGLGGDAMSLDYLSKRLGVSQYREVDKPTGSFSQIAQAGVLRPHGRWVQAPLMYPHEIEQAFARETGRLLVLSPGWAPLVIQRNNILNGFLKEWIDD